VELKRTNEKEERMKSKRNMKIAKYPNEFDFSPNERKN